MTPNPVVFPTAAASSAVEVKALVAAVYLTSLITAFISEINNGYS